MTLPNNSNSGLDRLVQRGRQVHDTAAGCLALAAADLARATRMATAMGRAKLEHSAASWSSRADMLNRLSASQNARLRAGVA